MPKYNSNVQNQIQWIKPNTDQMDQIWIFDSKQLLWIFCILWCYSIMQKIIDYGTEMKSKKYSIHMRKDIQSKQAHFNNKIKATPAISMSFYRRWKSKHTLSRIFCVKLDYESNSRRNSKKENAGRTVKISFYTKYLYILIKKN